MNACPPRLARHVARFDRVATASRDGMARYYAASAREYLAAGQCRAAFLAVESGIGALRSFHPKYQRKGSQTFWRRYDDMSVPPTRDMLPPEASSDRTKRRRAAVAVHEASSGDLPGGGAPGVKFRWR